MHRKTKTEIPTTSGTTRPAAIAVLLLGRPSECEEFADSGESLAVSFMVYGSLISPTNTSGEGLAEYYGIHTVCQPLLSSPMVKGVEEVITRSEIISPARC